jgi:hypothetical protein
MDEDWARDVLIRWIRLASVAQSPGSSPAMKGPAVDRLREIEHQTRSVISRIQDTSTPALITEASREYVHLEPGIVLAKYALGVLNTKAETAAHLGTRAPVMAADALHATVWGAASGLWADGHHGQAVQRAATFLNAHVQDLTGRNDLSDSALMAQVFSTNVPEQGKPRLRWPGDDNDLTVKAMRSGILNFSQGCYMAIRNPATHSREDMPKQIALEQLAVLSTLARWIDGCELLEPNFDTD